MIKLRLPKSKVRITNGEPKVFGLDDSVIDNHINSTILSKISGKIASSDKFVYSIQNPWTPQFTRNPTCWLNGVSNISCFSPAQLSGAAWYARSGNLISPRHFTLAKHFIFTILSGGTELRFVDDNNNVVTRKATKIITDPLSDIAVGILDADVPNNIKFAKVLPPHHKLYFQQEDVIRYAVFLDSQEKASIGINTYLPSRRPRVSGQNNVIYVQNPNFIAIPSLKDRIHPSIYNFYESPVAPDSGNPMFLIIDNELVMIGHWTTSISGPAYTGYFDIINSMMTELGGGYQLTPIDLRYVYNKYK